MVIIWYIWRSLEGLCQEVVHFVGASAGAEAVHCRPFRQLTPWSDPSARVSTAHSLFRLTRSLLSKGRKEDNIPVQARSELDHQGKSAQGGQEDFCSWAGQPTFMRKEQSVILCKTAGEGQHCCTSTGPVDTWHWVPGGWGWPAAAREKVDVLERFRCRYGMAYLA